MTDKTEELIAQASLLLAKCEIFGKKVILKKEYVNAYNIMLDMVRVIEAYRDAEFKKKTNPPPKPLVDVGGIVKKGL